MTTPSTLHMHIPTRTRHALQRGSEGKRLLVHCHEGKPRLWRSVLPVRHVRSSVIIMVLSTVRAICSYLLVHFVSNCETGGGR